MPYKDTIQIDRNVRRARTLAQWESTLIIPKSIHMQLLAFKLVGSTSTRLAPSLEAARPW